jgi:BlaI family transcriptional regulator, penicillinase repressor
MKRPLGQLQLEVLRVLWSQGEATVAEIQRALQSSGDWAYTTLATVLQRLERAGTVARRMDGRSAVYSAKVSEDQVGHSVLRDLLDRFFAGSHAKLVSQLLDETDVDADELDRIRELVAEKTDRPASKVAASKQVPAKGAAARKKRGGRS